MKNKKKLVIVSLLLVALFSFSVISSIASTYTPEIDMESMEEKINAFSNSTTQYKIEKIKYLKSVTNNTGYQYVLCDLNPSGYAVFTVDNIPLEICYTEDADPPIPMSDRNTYYYTCPGFVVETNGVLVDCETNRQISNDDITAVSVVERRISATHNSVSSTSNTRAATATEVYQVPNSHYFDNLINYGTNSTSSSCSAVAAGMLFGYYDFYVNSNYVATQYTQTTTGHSTGTSEAFHTLLCDYIWGDDPIAPISLAVAKTGLDNYLEDRGFSFTFSITPIAQNMAYFISTRRPVVGTVFESGSSIGHAVLVYRCSISGSTRMYSVHMGYKSKTHPSNWQVLNESLFGSAGYIYDCMSTGNHTYSYRYTSNNYHSGSSHYYEKEKYCTKCPVDCNEVIWESRPCSNCIEIMNTVDSE